MKQFTIPDNYKSTLISNIKNKRRLDDKLKKDFEPTLLDFGSLQIFLARHFGFCYGVENAIEIAFKTIADNPDKRIYLLSEMIHNPQVNADLEAGGVIFLQDTYGKQLIDFDTINKDDIVLIPAFGTTLDIEKILRNKGIAIEKYNTTCPFVEKVWNRSEQIAKKGYSIVIHGKPKHEETRATFSHAALHSPSVIVNDMTDTIMLAQFITGESDASTFNEVFKGKYSAGFDAANDLQRFGVVNQTTQLASDTQAISDYLKQVVKAKYQLTEETIGNHFADTKDTLCYATNDNQTAVRSLLETEADIALVIGGYNSSNTSHLVELCEKKLPTYFIDSAKRMINQDEIVSTNWITKEQAQIQGFLPKKEIVKVLITSGASCPDSLVEEVISKLASFYNAEEVLEKIKVNFQL